MVRRHFLELPPAVLVNHFPVSDMADQLVYRSRGWRLYSNKHQPLPKPGILVSFTRMIMA
jgi:hypothetical protein